jgi:hypothetical protein
MREIRMSGSPSGGWKRSGLSVRPTRHRASRRLYSKKQKDRFGRSLLNET